MVERKPKSPEVVNLRELKTQQDVVHELGMHNHRDITMEQSRVLFYRIGEAIKDMSVSDDVTTVVNMKIDGVDYHVTLQPINESLALSVTKTTQAPLPKV